ncbi:hypothetical protein BJ170DRAFT_466371 [Xylariales sp. AK1849]|nr:hypothetical protein BJ170DRAFT_466371 [Xylariales sp. AK1849]
MSRYGGSRYSDSESDLDIRVSRRHASPARPARAPVQYVEAPRRRPYYDDHERYLAPAQERMVVTTRSRSRDRRQRESSPRSPPPAQAPVIINNHIINHSDSDSDSDSGHEHRMQIAHHRSHSRAGSSSYYRDNYHDHERDDSRRRAGVEREIERSRKDFELERAQKELQELKLVQQIERDEKRRNKSYEEERELRDAKKELDDIRRTRDREENEKRIKQKLELQRLKEEEMALVEKKRREKEAKEAVEKYKKDEAERELRKKAEAEERDREYKHKMQEHLLKSGLGEKEINAILAGKKVENEKEKEKGKKEADDDARPTYTRMARRHLSLETLRVYDIHYQLDTDPDYVLIRRWVPESEQDMLWRHTKIVREQRSGKLVMSIEDKPKKHRHGNSLEPDFEWVRKKERKRSRSPSVLMYLAGARPA